MFKNFFEIIEKKHFFDENNPWYHGSQTYFDCISEELSEVKAELVENNSVYLEDEIGDVFWTLFHFIKGLEKERKITSLENIIKRAEKKYSERLEVIANASLDEKSEKWRMVKEQQKQELAREHSKKYDWQKAQKIIGYFI